MSVQDVSSLLLSDRVTICLILFLIAAITYRLTSKPRNLPPSLPSLPLIGSYPWLEIGKRGLYEVTLEFSKKTGIPLTTFYLGTKRVLILHDWNTIKEAYVKMADVFSDKFQFTFFLKELAKYGLISNNGPSWKLHRKFALASLREFGVGKQSLEDKILEELDVLEEEFLASSPQNDLGFDPSHVISNSVSNIICNIVFGRRYKYSDVEFRSLLHQMDVIFVKSRYGLILQTVPLAWLFRRYLHYYELQSIFDSLINFVQGHIDEHRSSFRPDNIRDFIDAYLNEMEKQEGDELHDKHLKKSIIDLFIAGSETTNTTLRWGLLYMAIYPQVQAKVQREIDAVIGFSRHPTIKDRNDMPYTEATIMEIQRVASIAPLALIHETNRDCVLNGFDVPKGTFVMPNLWACHKDPRYFDEPELFKPERFLDQDGKVVSKPESFAPFSAGRRVCLGEPLARMELFLFFTFLLQKFTISLPPDGNLPDLRPVIGLTLSPKPYKVVFKSRK